MLYDGIQAPHRLWTSTAGCGAKMGLAIGCLALVQADLVCAAEPPIETSPVSEEYDISSALSNGSAQGLYFGGSIGAAVQADNRFGPVFDLSNDDGAQPGSGGGGGLVDGRGDTSNLISGVHLGYNWQFGNTVAGVEGDIGAYGSTDNTLGSLRGRVGFEKSRSLIYATAGLGYISIDGGKSAVFAGGSGGSGGNGGNGFIAGDGGGGGAGAPNGMLFRENQSEYGFVAGIGTEYRIAPQAMLGVEALYYNFGNLDKAGFDDEFFVVRGRLSMGLGEHGGGLTRGNHGGSANWMGAYIGGHAGVLFDLADDTIDAVRRVNAENGTDGANGADIDALDGAGGGGGGGGGGTAVGLFERDDASLLGGVQLGYNWQNGHWVYGVEADGSFGAHDRDYLASLRGRLGWAYSSHLFYVTGGVGFTRVDGVAAIFGGDGGDGGQGSNSVNLGGDGSGGAGGAGGAAAALSVTQLDAFLAKEIEAAKDQGVLFSLHLKATMMKVSDPIIFGHAVRVFYGDLFFKYKDLFEGLGWSF